LQKLEAATEDYREKAEADAELHHMKAEAAAKQLQKEEAEEHSRHLKLRRCLC
jgi:hypothetical protein